MANTKIQKEFLDDELLNDADIGVTVQAYDAVLDATTASFTTAQETKLGHITVTQAVDLDAIEAASHAAVTVSDSSEIDLTLTGQQISASIVAGSIDESKLDASVNASLDLADTSVQPNSSPTFATITATTEVITPEVRASASGGLLLEANNGTDIGLLGAGNTANVAWYGSHNYDTATQDTIAAFTGAGKTLGSLATATYPSLTELAYVKGVTSAIQTQLDAKLASSAYDDATSAETNTGTSTAKYVSPDGLAGSYAGTKSVSIQVFDGATDVTTGDGKAYITIPEALNGMNLVRAQATVVTAGTTGATTIMIHNKTDAADMLSGAISIASGGTVGTVGTINGAADDVATNDIIRLDIDSVSTTAPQGLNVVLEFRLA